MEMHIKKYAQLFFIALPILVALDMSWIGVIAGQFYNAYLGHLLSESYNYYSLVVFYVLYTSGIMYFAILPALSDNAFTTAFIRGAALGFFCYMFYDLTNMTVLPNWPLMVTVLDVAWGTIVTACTASLTYLLAVKLYNLNSPEVRV